MGSCGRLGATDNTLNLASIQIGPIEFVKPHWLGLVVILWVLSVWLARSSLSGLGTTARRVALVVRLLVILLLVGALAQPQWTRTAENVNTVVVTDHSDSIPVEVRQEMERYLREAEGGAEKGDTLGRVTGARDAYVQTLPGPPGDRPDSQNIGATDGTNLAEAIKLAMAITREDKANRVVVISDGNETDGKLLSAAEAARAAGIPIDVLPIRYKYAREVIAERLVSPATARMGETVNLRVILNATHETTGRLDMTVNGQPVDLDPDGPEMGMPVALKEGSNAIPVQFPINSAGPQRFAAVFTPTDGEADTVTENNRQEAITFTAGKGSVLVIAADPALARSVVEALAEAEIVAEVRDPDRAPQSLIEWSAFDAVVLIDTPAYAFSQAQQEEMRAYVHDVGGGLIMLGGPESFGAGGWIGSPVADALPVKLEVPEKRKMPRGALALIMHSCEMPQGNYWGKQICLQAVDQLSRLDVAGVAEYSWGKGEYWVHPLSELGNKSAIKRAINSLTFGDAPSFQGFLSLVLPDLQKVSAGAKHVVIVSDGDPAPPSQALLQGFIDSKITISCVLVFPHGGGVPGTMADIAQATGGRSYLVNTEQQFAQIPRIIIKEAQVVKRQLIWEGNPITPKITAGSTEPMRGIRGLPPVRGYIVTAERTDRLVQTVAVVGEENDPLLAQGQYGLGKAVAFTSDAAARWSPDWIPWEQYKSFWAQHIRWAMRPTTSADLRVTTEDRGDQTHVIVDAFDENGEPLSFLRWQGAVVGPDGTSSSVPLRQFAPGKYETTIDSSRAGSYMLSFRYQAPGEGAAREGTVQAAVTRPFADEYRSLQDNAALLVQVAKLTGGRVLNDDPRIAQLWSRDGLTMPVASRPIWLAVAVAAIGLFLMDVAVRRVRIDIFAMAATVRRGFGKRATQAGQQMGSLKEARERAKEAMAARVQRPQPGEAPAVPVDPAAAKAVRNVKFEASEEDLAKLKKRPGGVAVELSGGEPEPGKPTPKQAPAAPGAEEGMSRLLKAKKRAQDEMTQD
jgi:uncharacterized membrane protein